MAPHSNDMPDLDRPVTRRELRAELQDLRMELRSELPGKAAMEAAKIELRQHIDVTMKSFRDELRTHFDIIAESLRADIHNMFDWMKANINGTNLAGGTERGAPPGAQA